MLTSFPRTNHNQTPHYLVQISFILAFLFVSPALALAQTNSSWVSGSGNWSNASNWSPNQVPNNGGGNTYSVTIDPGNFDTVSLDENVTVSSLTLGSLTGSETLLLDAIGDRESLTITGNLTVNTTGGLGVDTLSAANVTDSGSIEANTITVTGTFNNNKGRLIIDGVATINNLVITSGGLVQVNGTLNLTNGITDIALGTVFDVSGMINAGSSSGLANLSTIEGILALDRGVSYTINSNTLAVQGILDLNGNSSLSVNNLTNSGTSTGPSQVTIGATEGSPHPTPSILTVNGTFTNSAEVFVGEFGAGDANIAILNNTGAGVVNIETGGILTLTSSATSNNSAHINIAKGSELAIGASNVTLAGDGTLTLKGGLISGVAAGDVLTNQSNIIGFGTIGNNSMGLVNDGLIAAADNGAVLTIDPSSAGLNNQGRFDVNAGATMDITGPANSFLNFNSATGTLTGGFYNVTNGTLQFDNANIVTNAANITLNGTQSKIIDQNGANALANFATNTSAGTFTLAGNRNFATSGAFSNAGSLTISNGSSFTVGGTANYTQTAGITTVIGTLSVSSPGSINLSGGMINDRGTITSGSYDQTSGNTRVTGSMNLSSGFTQSGGITNMTGNLAVGSGDSVHIAGGSFFAVGTITGNINLTGGLLSAGPGSMNAGELTFSGAYSENGAGALKVDLGGTTAGTQYDVLNITSTASLGGTLNVDLISGFKPTVGESFDIMNYSSETGTFTKLNLPKLAGGDTWSISYNTTDVVLTVVAPASTHNTPIASPATRVSRNIGSIVSASASNTHEPVAILSRVSCFAARLLGSASCDKSPVPIASHDGQTRSVAAAGASLGQVHNNVMIATRSAPAGAGTTSHEASASAAAMARLYACAYFPADMAHTMGCR